MLFYLDMNIIKKVLSFVILAIKSFYKGLTRGAPEGKYWFWGAIVGLVFAFLKGTSGWGWFGWPFLGMALGNGLYQFLNKS